MSMRYAEAVADESRSAAGGVPKRSRKGCPECKKSRVKCDEQRPSCGRCQRLGRQCHISSTLFKPHALSSEAVTTRDAPQTISWRQSPAQVHFTTPADEADESGENLDTSRSDSGQPPVPPQASDNLFQTAENAGTTPTPSQLSPSNRRTPMPIDLVHDASETSHFDFAEEHVSASDRLEESFFVRHFSESIAPWFDLVNFQRYFGHECIVLIREHSLLRFAMCALSAKQLGQSLTSTAMVFSNSTQERVAYLLLQGDLTFPWYGAKYYDKAIKTLARQITPREPHIAHLSPMSFSQGDVMTRAEGEDPIVRLLATCLLIQYENLSGNTRGWRGHLNGFANLLALFNESFLLYASPWSPVVIDAKSQRALRAAFWWYVVNDLEESFVARRSVRVDLDNISIWRHMGLHVHDNWETIDLDSSGTPDAPPHLQEDLLSFALIRKVSKLVNALAVSRSEDSTGYSSLSEASELVSRDDGVKFQEMEQDLDRWMTSATAAFHPDIIWRSLDVGNNQDLGIFGTERWYSHSFRAVTMLYYHMARVLLLSNQPPSLLKSQIGMSGQTFDLLKMLRNIERRLTNHAEEIVSIAKGMLSDGAVRARALQPLYVAGKSMTRKEDRQRLIEMIRATQDDLGLICEYRVEHLIEEWGVTFEELGLSKRRNQRRASEW